VSGPGPLSGLYLLEDGLDERCQDLCAYKREGELYCFEKVESSYQTEPCSCVPCGDDCLDMFEAPLYQECEGQCQLTQQPCNGSCSEGFFLCGDICMGGEFRDNLIECDGGCQDVEVPCGGTCQQGRKLCMEGSICVEEEDEMYKECDGECVAVTTPCNGVCPNTTFLCGDECVPLTNTNLTNCQGECQPASQPCDGECQPGLVLCGDECLADSWVCGDECVPITTTCQGDCLPGYHLQDGECVDTAGLCPEQQCVSDDDCQADAACVLQGTTFYCQCSLGYQLDTASTHQCPHTGSCVPAGCGGAPCYGGDGVSVCPYCNASYQNITYNYQTTENKDLMLFESSTSSCSMMVSWSCWYDIKDMVTPFSTVELYQVSSSGCNVTAQLLSPLACPMALPMH